MSPGCVPQSSGLSPSISRDVFRSSERACRVTHTPTCLPIRERRQRAEHAELPRRHRQGRGVEGQARFSLQRDRNSTGGRTHSQS